MGKVVIGAEVKLDNKGAESSVKSFKQQLKEANAEVIKLSEKFGATSKEAIAAAQKVAKLKDAIGDAKALSDAFSPDAKFNAFAGAIQGAAAGFSALQGAQALFGNQSKDLEQTLVKIQAAMAFTQGLNGIMGAKDAFVNLAAVIKGGVTSAFGTLRAAIISTGVGALVVLIGTLIANFDKVKKAIINLIPGAETFFKVVGDIVDKVTGWLGITEDQIDAQKALEDATKDLTDALGKYYDQIDRTNKIEILRAKIAGQSDAQIEALEKKAVDRKVDQVSKLIGLAKEYGISTQTLEAERGRLLEEQEIKSYENRLKTADRFREEQKKREEEERRRLEAWAKQYQDQRDSIANFFGNRPKTDRSFIDDSKDILGQQVQATKDLLTQDAENRQAYFNRITDQRRTALQDMMAAEEAERNAKLQTLGVVAQASENFANLIGKQTAAGKALAIAAATINTYKAASEALKADYGVFGPAAQVARVLTVASVIATGLQQVRNIAKVQVPGGGGGGSVPNISASSAQLSPIAQSTTIDQNSINAIGNAAGRAYVLESDVSGNAERVRRLNRAARIN